MTSRTPQRPRRLHPALAPAALVLIVLGALAVVAACRQASATEVRSSGAALGGPAAARADRGPVPPPSAPPPRQPVAAPAPAISARAAVVLDDASGAVLYEFNGRTRLPPASLTKIATAALALDRGRLDDWVTIDFDYTEPELDDASVMGLEQGDRFRLRDLIYGMLLPSGADASIAIGRHISGSDAAFVKDLNAFLDSLGLTDTHFTDAFGLGGPNHLSTARDIALLSRYAMRQPLFAQAARAEEWKALGSRTITVYNTNPWEFGYEGGDGVKSGYTEEAGPTLSASATRAGHRVIVVVLNASRRNPDTTALMDWAFRTFCWNDGALGCAAAAPGTTR